MKSFFVLFVLFIGAYSMNAGNYCRNNNTRRPLNVTSIVNRLGVERKYLRQLYVEGRNRGLLAVTPVVPPNSTSETFIEANFSIYVPWKHNHDQDMQNAAFLVLDSVCDNSNSTDFLYGIALANTMDGNSGLFLARKANFSAGLHLLKHNTHGDQKVLERNGGCWLIQEQRFTCDDGLVAFMEDRRPNRCIRVQARNRNNVTLSLSPAICGKKSLFEFKYCKVGFHQTGDSLSVPSCYWN
eukprot:m.128037 g.128037  ORF g.128037 m.128037 type:complete len:240 (+) comp37941_c0_seq2:1673-2392(+)